MTDMPKARIGSSVGEGWEPIVKALDEEIRKIDPEYTLDQYKEKFGGLRFYYTVSEKLTPEQSVKLEALVDDGVDQANQTCEFCGKEGHLRTSDDYPTKQLVWLKTLCDEHADKYYLEDWRPWNEANG